MPQDRRAARSPTSASGEPEPGDRIRLVVRAIPAGRVSTYGQVAALAGLPGRARLVGRVLGQLPAGSRLPWHRVVAAGGRIAERGGGEHEQRQRLRAEGVGFTASGRVDLKRYGLDPVG